MLDRRVLVRRPSPRLAEGLVTHIERTPVDVDLAMRQWQGYVEALTGAGWEVTEVDPAPECPDSAFVEETVVTYGDLAVVTRPGARERRPETAAAENSVREAGYRIAHIEAPGTLDGGDVLKFGGTVYVGRGGRTNDEGIRRLRAHLERSGQRGVQVVTVPLTKVLHLKSAVTALPDGSVVGYEPLVDDPGVFPRFRPVPEVAGAHVVLLDDERVLMSSRAPASAGMFSDLGYAVVPVDISEFEKLEGCVTCLSVRMRGV